MSPGVGHLLIMISECLRSARASMLCVLAVLSGCSVGPEFKRPEPPAAARYTSETLSWDSSAGVLGLTQVAA